MRIVLVSIAMLVSVASAFASNIPTLRDQVATNEKQIALARKVISLMNGQLAEAKSALEKGKALSDSELSKAHIYFEASRRVAEVGVALDDANPTNVPLPKEVEKPLEYAKYSTAALALERLSKGLDAYKTYQDFVLAYTSGEYDQNIKALEDRIASVSSRLTAIEKQGDVQREELDRRTRLVGNWIFRDEDGEYKFIFSDDNSFVLYLNGGEKLRGTWTMSGNDVRTVSSTDDFNFSWILGGTSLLGDVSFTRQ